jgi:hypothetical protein
VGGAVHSISDTTWREDTVTYNTRPAVSSSPVSTLGAASPGTIAEFALDGVIAGDGTYNLAITTTLTDGVYFRSSRATGGAIPALVLTVADDVPPPPARNTAPVVTITTPPSGTTVVAGNPVTLTATAIDLEDGDIVGTIVWTSDLDGPLGPGQSVSLVLSEGRHQVTARVEDGGGLAGTATVTLDVVAPAAPTETLVFEPAADTYVYEKKPTGNLSAESVLRIDTDADRIIYLRFAVSGLSGRPVLAARLRLDVVDGSDVGGTVHLISNTTWQEETVTYATRPAVDGAALDTRGAVAAGEIVEFDLLGAILDDGVYNFAIVTTSTDGAHYRSSRATSGQIPRLELTVPVGPEPTVRIIQPADGSVYFDGDLITFQAAASDIADGDLGAVVDWASDRDGPLGTGATAAAMLSLGTHTITATVTDSDTFTAMDAITVTVSPPPPPNTEPVVAITAPRNGQTFTRGRSVKFSGTATDLEDGTISGDLVWTSSLDNALAMGASVTATVWGVGTHTVTASVTDSGGLVGLATRTIVIEAGSGTGFQDFSFGSGVDQDENRVTASKAESKLWHNDGIWWATLYNPAAGGGYRIHALDPLSQTWLDTGVLVDARKTSRQDALWTGEKLYLTSRAGSGKDNRLYRFSYDPAGSTYTLDPGFPVTIPSAFTEALTIARDSTGRLWVSYTSGGKVFVNCTIGSDAQWGKPVQIPGRASAVGADDVSAVVALPGERIGVFWSNQSRDAFYFAVHPDGAAVTKSWTLETADSGGDVADDHFNVKRASDGRIFVAVKTSKAGSTSTLIGLLVRSASGTWSSLHRVARVSVDPTRPSCLLDEEAGRVYVFYSLGKSAVYYKTSSMNEISFPGGKGTAFMEKSGVSINNPTTTKQSVNASTGLVVVGSTPDTRSYWHNTIGLP